MDQELEFIPPELACLSASMIELVLFILTNKIN